MRVVLVILQLIILCYSQYEGMYYKQMLNENQEKSKLYNRPSRNEEFENFQNTNCTNFGLYDFIIIGAGSAGAVLANRLSEIYQWQILLIEAGGDETEYSIMPGAFPGNLNSETNWGYLSSPQSNACLGFINKQCDFSRGKVLGGSSSINAMLYVKNNPTDFSKWGMLQYFGWNHWDTLPYFIKSENATEVIMDWNYRGTDGPLHISYTQPKPNSFETILNAHAEFGYKYLDYNGAEQIGISRMQTTTKNGRRFSTNQAYLKPIIKYRPNLHIVTKALATKIYFTEFRQAYAIKFLNRGTCFYAHAAKEIIVSAGSINTPQLLMLSGIGPEYELYNLNIPVIVDLPVGKNLEDHPTIMNLKFRTNRNIQVNMDDEYYKYVYGEGLLTSTPGEEINFMNVFPPKVEHFPDIEVFFGSVNPFVENSLFKKSFNLDNVLDSFLNNTEPNDLFANIVLLHPKSKGEVTLKSSDPLDFPIINPNYLNHPEDAEKMYRGIQNILALLQTESFKSLNARFVDVQIDACNKLNSREKWFCIIKYLTQGIYHPIATCKMGLNMHFSVVDQNCLVHGVKSLRVVDASIIPTSISGHTNSFTIMIAEKIADKIKFAYGFY